MISLFIADPNHSFVGLLYCKLFYTVVTCNHDYHGDVTTYNIFSPGIYRPLRCHLSMIKLCFGMYYVRHRVTESLMRPGTLRSRSKSSHVDQYLLYLIFIPMTLLSLLKVQHAHGIFNIFLACEPGWIYVYAYGCYMVSRTRGTWSEWKRLCGNFDASLVTMETQT